MTVIAIGIVVVLLLAFVAWRLGKATTKKDQAVKQAKESKEDADISSKPYIDSPFSRMRGKK